MPSSVHEDYRGKVYYAEIDGLRAVAVAAVIIYHYFEDLVPSGYIGVDVFFVISGFVITSYMYHAPKNSRLDFFVSFLARRIRRLLPALLVCVTLTAIAFVNIVTRPPKEVFQTGAFALAGLSNIQLWLLSQDYFAVDVRLNPFTHTWSLGVEEQFYLIFPLLFIAFGYSWHSRVMTPTRLCGILASISLVSVIAFLALMGPAPQTVFYLMPFRFWELGLGSLAFLATVEAAGRRLPDGVVFAFGVAIAICFFLPASWQPAPTVLAVAAAAGLVFGIEPGSYIFKLLSCSSMVHIGRMSYSLYLWHGSILVLGKWTLGTSNVASFVLLAITAALAWISYHVIEEPIRRATWLRPQLLVVVLGMALTIPLFQFVWQVLPKQALAYNNNLPTLLGVEAPGPFADVPCHGRTKVAQRADAMRECLTPDRTPLQPLRITLLGESHAAQLYPMVLAAVENLPYRIAFINSEDYDEFPFGLLSGSTQSRVLDFVTQNLNAGDVLLIAFHRGQLRLDKRRDRHIGSSEVGGENTRSRNFIAAMQPYIERWSERGARVIFINDTPLMRVVSSSAACMLQLKLFGQSICRITREQDLRTRALQDGMYAKLTALSPSVLTWDPAPTIYGSALSLDIADAEGRYLMWDWNHISEHQARMLAPSFRAFLLNEVNPS